MKDEHGSLRSDKLREVMPGLFVHAEGMNTGILTCGEFAVLINCGNKGLLGVLDNLGIKSVDRVLFTHHRRELADGLSEILDRYQPQIGVPRVEEWLFTKPEAYWTDEQSRWGALCHCVPYHATHVQKIPVSHMCDQGEALQWGEWTISVSSTPGYTDGSVSYVIEKDNLKVAFTGDLIYGPGMIRDLYSLQHADAKNGHEVGGYHGFMGSMETLIDSLGKVRSLAPDLLIPAHGTVIERPDEAISLLVSRLRNAYRNYVSVSALRWYFPKYFASHNATEKMLPMQETVERPGNIKRVQHTTWALIAGSGRALLLDPSGESTVRKAEELIERNVVKGYDAIWITHYHSDHMDVAEEARQKFRCPVMTSRVMADVLSNPKAHLLTCLVDKPVKVDRPTVEGETWRWENFTLSSYHLPGQTFYHSGLFVVADNGNRYLFAGDSFTPTGIDDYCSWNRNFLGENVGFDRCVKLVQSLRPCMIFNQHVEPGFRFTDEACDLILENLTEREALLAEMMPWWHPNFGTDERWISVYPYEQTIKPGATAPLQVRVMNHDGDAHEVRAAFMLPEGWGTVPCELDATCIAREETRLNFDISVPKSGGAARYVLPVCVSFGGLNLGSFREAIVEVR